ncbi:hypothetical protein NKH19_29445 [Mesorhizobium sp. M1338]|uniref:hypothetical protein n=1 Tax=unclassified Mesorhizobium TaxID=325217 RepID=UPI00333D0338
MPVSFKDILLAFEFVSSGGTGEHQAFLCKQSGTLYWHSEFTGDLDELPDDIDDSDKYAQIPDKKELDLGKPLALDFARQFLPDNVGDVQKIFSKRGAYARFKDLLQRRGALDRWYAFEANAEERASRGAITIRSRSVTDTAPESVARHLTPRCRGRARSENVCPPTACTPAISLRLREACSSRSTAVQHHNDAERTHGRAAL